jgi:ribosome biogenesis GTPase
MGQREESEGLIVQSRGAQYRVASGGEEVLCVLRGRFRIESSAASPLPVVGDIVRFRREKGRDARGSRGLILGVKPRKSILARTDASQRGGYQVLAANMDRAILVFSVREPMLNLRLLDRMLVAAECGSMEAVVAVNKIDLAGACGEIDEEIAPYRAIGYRVVLCSARSGEGVGELAVIMRDSLSVLAGPSGAGKTSLISRMQPGLELVVGSVSAKTGKGRHTTTHFALHPLEGGGYLGDTPGVREFGVWGITRERLSQFFRDFSPFRAGCRFTTCTHTHEPDCSVKEAVDRGLVSRSRYESYVRIFATLPKR